MQAIIRNRKDLKEFAKNVDSIDAVIPALIEKQVILSEKMAKLVSDLNTMPELLSD